MPTSPSDAQSEADLIRQVLDEATSELMNRLAKSLSRGIDGPTWAKQQLGYIRSLRKSFQKDLRSTVKVTGRQMEGFLKSGYQKGWEQAAKDLGSQAVTGMRFRGIDKETLSALLKHQAGIERELRKAVVQVATRASQRYVRVVNDVTRLMVTGTMTRREATARAVAQWATEGVARFTDKSGRNWRLESYGEMATRTAVGQASIEGHINSLVSAGRQLIQVSDSPEECELCRPWEGQVLWIKGGEGRGTFTIDGKKVKVAGTLRQATASGLFHPNCRHRSMVYIPGRSKAMENTEDPKGDELRRKQRSLERRERDLKRRVSALKELGDTNELTKARKKLREHQGLFSEWRTAHNRKNLSYRTKV